MERKYFYEKLADYFPVKILEQVEKAAYESAADADQTKEAALLKAYEDITEIITAAPDFYTASVDFFCEFDAVLPETAYYGFLADYCDD